MAASAASFESGWNGPGRELQRVNVEGTRAVFAAASGAGARRAVHVTSMWTVLRPDLARTSPYVRSRCDSEQAALDASGCMQTVIACPTFVRVDARTTRSGKLKVVLEADDRAGLAKLWRSVQNKLDR